MVEQWKQREADSNSMCAYFWAWLQVVFRPIRMEHYSDQIEIMFVGTNTSFIVDVQAFTPVTDIQVTLLLVLSIHKITHVPPYSASAAFLASK